VHHGEARELIQMREGDVCETSEGAQWIPKNSFAKAKHGIGTIGDCFFNELLGRSSHSIIGRIGNDTGTSHGYGETGSL